MSFWVYLLDNYCETCKRGDVVDEFNITHNVNEILERCIVRSGGAALVGENAERSYRDRAWGRLDGHEASFVTPILIAAYNAMIDPVNREELLSLEPENRWGTLHDLTQTLKSFIRSCEKYPNAVVRANG